MTPRPEEGVKAKSGSRAWSWAALTHRAFEHPINCNSRRAGVGSRLFARHSRHWIAVTNKNGWLGLAPTLLYTVRTGLGVASAVICEERESPRLTSGNGSTRAIT
jgi:hypothetical protein